MSIDIDSTVCGGPAGGKVDTFLIDAALIRRCLESGARIPSGRDGFPRRIVVAPSAPSSLVVRTAQAGPDDVVDLLSGPEVMLAG